ncbi:retroviral-like aspartic protease family protein [Phenylobacterium sp. LjRoot219]|uniref:retroviral-like aspartic protease family protein n=1 Tax=Phenylobacterium sp. LjRoot219 TaxID=3342283 RepID=UPI003ECE324E
MLPTRRDAIQTLLASAAAGLAPLQAWGQSQPATRLGPPNASSAPPVSEPGPPSDPDGEVAGGRTAFDQLTAPVTLNGQGPFPFIVDTGASVSCVSSQLAATLGLPLHDKRPVHTIVGVKAQSVTTVDEMRVGVRRQRRMRALAIPLEQPEVQGVLAVDWLKGQRLTLNFAKNRLEFAGSRSEESAPGQVVVPARRKHGQLTIVDADLGDQRISAMIDSGSELSLCNTPLLNLLDRRQALPARRQVIEMVTVIGEPFSGELMYLPFLRLGGLQLGNVAVVHADTYVFKIWGLEKKPAILLGMDLLREFQAVSLDFGRSQVRFDLPPGAL